MFSRYVSHVRAADYNSIKSSAKGVYAWYPPAPTELSTDFLKDIYNYYSRIHSAAISESMAGKRYTIGVERNPIVFSSSVYTKEVAKEDVDMVLSLVCELTSPLYVGKAVGKDGVRGRVKDEYNSLEFRRKFVNLADSADVVYYFNFEDCIIKYIDLHSFCEEKNIHGSLDKLSELLELVTFWADFPALNAKAGN
nr:hypothetical protein BN993_04047 [Virgibacillus halodenitrificans]